MKAMSTKYSDLSTQPYVVQSECMTIQYEYPSTWCMLCWLTWLTC